MNIRLLLVNSSVWHSRLPYEVNRAIVDLAAQKREHVCGVDLAGGDAHYADRQDEFIGLYAYARSLGLNTTGHLYETKDGCYPALLPYLMRIGHGIQIPLHYPALLKEVAARRQCLEVCPTHIFKDRYFGDDSSTQTCLR